MTNPTDPPPSQDGETHADHSMLASAIERGIFASRWLLAPLYLGLTVSLLLLLVKFVQGTVELARQTGTEDANKLITGILSLIDLSLMGNLLVMVMFAGYENFVSRFRGGHERQPARLDGQCRLRRPETEADDLDHRHCGDSYA